MSESVGRYVSARSLVSGDKIRLPDGRPVEVTASKSPLGGDNWCLSFDDGDLVHFPSVRIFLREVGAE